ncbi:MAG: response regulator [Candidatus Hydrogenedentes bacterium]|nr:response regulator [Candidatus Hydrogenedentota bacterium]
MKRLESKQSIDVLLPGGTETILLAEDEELVRGLTQQMLEQAGYRVLVARDGLEAFQMYQTHGHEVDLLLFDVVMPNLSGPDAYMRIAQIRPDVPILFVSGFASDFLKKSTLPLQHSTLLRKPYSIRELRQSVRDQLDAR